MKPYSSTQHPAPGTQHLVSFRPEAVSNKGSQFVFHCLTVKISICIFASLSPKRASRQPDSAPQNHQFGRTKRLGVLD
jgi:hypothetical protein